MLDIFFVRRVLKKLKKMKIFDSFLWKERKNALSCVWERKYIFGASLWPKNSENRILPFPWLFSIWRIIICSLHMCCPSLICLCWSLLQRRKHIHLMMTTTTVTTWLVSKLSSIVLDKELNKFESCWKKCYTNMMIIFPLVSISFVLQKFMEVSTTARGLEIRFSTADNFHKFTN